MKVRNRIVSYLRGDRRGKEANALEREALNDAFLYEALEGLTGTQRDVVRDIEYLSKRVKERTKRRWGVAGKVWGVLVAVVVIGFGVWFGFRYSQADRGLEQNDVSLRAANNVQEKKIEERMPESDTLLLEENAEQEQPYRQPDSIRIHQKQASPELSAPVVRGKRDTVVEGNQGSVPFGGYKKFYRYIQDSLRYPQDALERGLEGEIKLSFYVNKAGRPSHIRVVKWITYSCNREAIRLLSEGPAWNYTGDTSYVVIPFRLKK